MADQARAGGGATRRSGVLGAVRERPLLVLCGLLLALVVGLDLARPGMVSAGAMRNTPRACSSDAAATDT